MLVSSVLMVHSVCIALLLGLIKYLNFYLGCAIQHAIPICTLWGFRWSVSFCLHMHGLSLFIYSMPHSVSCAWLWLLHIFYQFMLFFSSSSFWLKKIYGFKWKYFVNLLSWCCFCCLIPFCQQNLFRQTLFIVNNNI